MCNREAYNFGQQTYQYSSDANTTELCHSIWTACCISPLVAGITVGVFCPSSFQIFCFQFFRVPLAFLLCSPRYLLDRNSCDKAPYPSLYGSISKKMRIRHLLSSQIKCSRTNQFWNFISDRYYRPKTKSCFSKKRGPEASFIENWDQMKKKKLTFRIKRISCLLAKLVCLWNS